MTTKDKVLQLLKESPDFLSGEKMHSNYKCHVPVFGKQSKN